jgi:hypothetical protein
MTHEIKDALPLRLNDVTTGLGTFNPYLLFTSGSQMFAIALGVSLVPATEAAELVGTVANSPPEDIASVNWQVLPPAGYPTPVVQTPASRMTVFGPLLPTGIDPSDPAYTVVVDVVATDGRTARETATLRVARPA